MFPPEIIAREQAVMAKLDALNITYQIFTHQKVDTVAQAKTISSEITGVQVKNLFLRDKKKNFFLITAEHEAQIDLKQAKEPLQASGNLSFASADYLQEHLGVLAGSVNPLALMFAPMGKIKFFLDRFLHQAENINMHPMRNDKSITLKRVDFLRFLDDIGHEYHLIDL